jgi:hypothetical protein
MFAGVRTRKVTPWRIVASAAGYWARYPPSITSLEPVMKLDMSEAELVFNLFLEDENVGGSK